MNAFTGPLTLTELEAGSGWYWRLEQPIVFRASSGIDITVPTGFVTDGATVPRPLWGVLPAWGTYSRAAVVHDFLCRSLDNGSPHPAAKTRKFADAIFYEAMVACGTGMAMRWAMWAAVRIFAALTGK